MIGAANVATDREIVRTPAGKSPDHTGSALVAAFHSIAGTAEKDPAAALVIIHRTVATYVCNQLGRTVEAVDGWSRPSLKEGVVDVERSIAAKVSGGGLIIRGHQPFFSIGSDGGASLLLIADEDPSNGGYTLSTISGEWQQLGQSIYDRPGFRIDKAQFERPLEITSFEQVPTQRWKAALSATAIVEEYLHAGLDYGLLRGFAAEAHTHLTTRTRPWQGQSLAKATDDPHLVRRYGEYIAARHALEKLMAEASDSIAAVAWDASPHIINSARTSVAVARSFASLTGRSVISGTIELLGASATSQRYGFDLFWRDFTAHAISSPSLWPVEAIGRDLLAPTHGEDFQ